MSTRCPRAPTTATTISRCIATARTATALAIMAMVRAKAGAAGAGVVAAAAGIAAKAARGLVHTLPVTNTARLRRAKAHTIRRRASHSRKAVSLLRKVRLRIRALLPILVTRMASHMAMATANRAADAADGAADGAIAVTARLVTVLATANSPPIRVTKRTSGL